ncbi:MAG: tetratricopeptide repeat protein [Syntrophorhabdales bacterium]|jgi:adenylate cyclase
MAPQDFKRKLTAILSADVKGYSRLMGEDEKGTVRTLNAYKEVMGGLTQDHHGRVVDAPGDNVLAEFASVVDAVECAVEIQKELKTRNAELPENRKMEFRIGVNLGDVMVDGEAIYGNGVNIAARLESLSEAGGICISGTAFDQVRNKLELGYDYLGEQTVKNIALPVRVYKVLMEPEAAGKVIGEKKAKPRQWQRAATGLVAAVIVVVATVAVWQLYLRPTRPPVEVASKEKMAFPLPDKPSIAVLPFVNMSKDPEQEYFCDGMTDQIITSLSIIPRLFVIARDSTFAYKGKAVKVQKVAEEMGVRYVLEGSIQKAGNRIRILVQLIDALKGIHLWSERYDRDLKDLFALQDEIARQVMTALQVKLTEGEYARGLAGTTTNLAALECLWRAEERFFRSSKEDNAAARQWAEKAIALDPRFAGAWAILGYTHFVDVINGWSTAPPESLKRAEECGQKALAINDATAKAQGLMGVIRWMQGRYDEAIRYAEKSVALNPNDPTMMFSLATIMHGAGRFEESISLIKTAMRICPYYPALYLRYLAASDLLAGRYQEAIEACEAMLERSRKGEYNPFYARIYLAAAYAGLGQIDKAKAQAEEVVKLKPNFSMEDEKFLTMYKDPANRERNFALLRKAGLK